MFLLVKKVILVVLVISLTFAFVGCSNTEYTKSDNVVEASMISDMLSNGNTIVIDARSADEYSKGHLVGAINLPPTLLSVDEPVSGTIAPKEQVEEVLSSFGISNTSDILIYDNNGVSASRVWWVLKVYGHENVRVINNGEASIVKENLELTLEVPTIQASNYTASDMNEAMVATLDEVKAVAEGQVEACIIDVRSLAEYDEGAIPTAILYPYTKNYYSDGSFKSARDIYLNYTDLGLDKDEPIILYCKTSYRATQTALMLNEAGFNDVKVYDGAWLEWSSQGMPQEEKPEETVMPTVQDGS